MVRSLILYIGILSFILIACQKETSFEVGKPARGSLQGSSGDCLPKLVNGTYKAGQALVDSNFIEVTLNIEQIGNYSVFTDTVNGYSFKVTGSTTSTGPLKVRMKGSGTPTTAGLNNFTVHFDTTICFVSVTVIPGSSSGGSAVFSLQGSPNACTNATVAGTYTQGTALNATNKVDVQVNVTTIGTWTMATNTVNGVTFAGGGTFTTTGVQTVTLNGAGTPSAAGAQTFTVTAGSSTCTFPVTYLPNTTPPAAYTLAGAPGACMNAVVSGTYTQGTPLVAQNNVAVQLNVTVVGQWTIATNTVAGMMFTGMGNLAGTGTQTVTLTGAGNPTAAGVHTFTVTAGSSTCTFTVTVVPSTPPPTGDHFPLTANSWWSYDDGSSAGDTLKRTNIGTAVFGPNTYREFEETDDAGAPVYSFFYRKDAGTGFYYEYAYVDDYSILTFDNPGIEGEILFLKENLTTNETWNSTEWSGNESGTPKKLRYKFTCTAANGTATINGKSYTNVHKITMKPQTAPGGTTTWSDEVVTWEFFYAQGIGLIYMKASNGVITFEFPMRNYKVF